jgi:hypothetical protein
MRSSTGSSSWRASSGSRSASNQHGHLFALAFQRTTRGENFFREIGRGVGEWNLWRRLRSGGGSRAGGTGPDEHLALLVPGELVYLDHFIPEEGQQIVIELKLDFERAIGDTATPPQHLQGLL